MDTLGAAIVSMVRLKCLLYGAIVSIVQAIVSMARAIVYAELIIAVWLGTVILDFQYKILMIGCVTGLFRTRP